MAVHPVRVSELQGSADLVFEDVLARVKEVRFAFPGWRQEDFPVCFVGNGDDSAPASYGPVAGSLVGLQTLDRHGNVVCDNVEGVELGGYCVSPVGRYWGRSVVLLGLMQG